MSEFQFYISFWILILDNQIWFLFFKFIEASLHRQKLKHEEIVGARD